MFMPMVQGGHHFAPAAIVTFTASAQNAADNLTSATFSSQALGAADPTRQIVVVVGAIPQAGDRVVSSLTVGGTSMSEIHTNQTAYSFASLWSCEKATGTSGDVVINFSGTMGQSVDCAVYALYNASTSEYAKTKAASGAPASLATTISIPAEGVCISHAQHNDDPTRSTSWTNLTERYDVLYDTHSTSSGASDAFATAQTDRVITATFSSAPDAAGMVTVSWAKA